MHPIGSSQRALGPKEGRGAAPSGMGNPRDGALLARRSHWHHVRAVQRKSRVGNSMASVHAPCAFRHGPISPSVFSQLAARNDPAPVRKCIPCVHAGRDFRHGGRRRPRQGQNVRPACTRGTMFPTWTRQGGTFPLPAGSVALYPGRKSIPRVHTGRDFRHVPRWTTGSECVCPRSRTPERTRLATCPQKRIGAPAVGDRPQHRTATLPPWFVRSSSLSSSLLATANWANAT